MAETAPSNPRKLLADAAHDCGSFSSVAQNQTWTELPRKEFPAWALDPREQERDHTAGSTSKRIYTSVPVEYVAFIAVESGASDQEKEEARADLDQLRSDYLDQLLGTTFPDAGEEGNVGKDGRQRRELQQGETSIMFDAISLIVHQNQRFGT